MELLSTSIQDVLDLFALDDRAGRFSDRTIGSTTPALIRGYLAHFQDRQWTDKSIHGSARTVKTFLNFCVREALIAQSPMRKVSMPKVGKTILLFGEANVSAPPYGARQSDQIAD